MFCLYHRWTINSAHDDSRELPDGTLAHLETCAPCRRHHEANAAATDALRAETQDLRAPAGLAEAVARQLLRQHASTSTPRFVLPAWAMAASAFALTALIWQLAQPPASPAPVVEKRQANTSTLPAVVPVNVEAVTDQMAASVIQPYTQEMKRLRQDFEAARDFLAASVVSPP